ncbi:MAG: hypothetical protein II393_02545 [Cytophagales bacterium]|nr:hypothetical protein [Cytophagales bacterium]
MSEIEKMYRTAKVVPSHHYCNDCQYNMSAECPIRCPDNVAVYPPFTAEKQIELIKWIAKKDCIFRVTYEREFLWCSQTEWQSSFCYEEFEESLANLINTIWQDLTEEEKQQVKGILE